MKKIEYIWDYINEKLVFEDKYPLTYYNALNEPTLYSQDLLIDYFSSEQWERLKYNFETINPNYTLCFNLASINDTINIDFYAVFKV